ncbi:hypothetical protein JOF56_006750 [Kibdelosporangium banguiense]|uniref:Sensor histidine kinase n=1 Tax=Kibdelosporangium banguiense TaxID=1365924 RepID=A0ABS4TPN8_9PSEU|nr:HAMP domain-containing histidine kinase [Kibdelosporangium banguiense]MBP2326365.1 hypothetical protein [Kibdelosporangium banguiense]
MADRIGKMTALVTALFALPLLGVAAYLVVLLRDEAIRPDLSPGRSTSLCVSNNIAATPQLADTPGDGLQPQNRSTLGSVCVDKDKAFTEPKRTTSLVLRDLDYPDWYLYASAWVDTSSVIPDVSIWPFTDPDTIGYFHQQRDFSVHSAKVPGQHLREINPDLYRAIADVQRTLNQRILLIAGAAMVLIALVAIGVRTALRRAVRPLPVPVPAMGVGSITQRLDDVTSDLVMLARVAPPSSESFDLAALAHQETAHRYPPNLAYVVDLGDDPVPVQGSRELIGRVLADLLDNAESQANSTVTLRLRATPQFAVLEAIVDDGGTASRRPH